LPDDINELTNSQILLVSHLFTVIAQALGHTAGTRYFFLSIVGISLFSAFSQITFLSATSRQWVGNGSLRGSCRGISDGFARLLPYACLLIEGRGGGRCERYHPYGQAVDPSRNEVRKKSRVKGQSEEKNLISEVQLQGRGHTKGMLILELGPCHCGWCRLYGVAVLSVSSFTKNYKVVEADSRIVVD
jgi:hypothetical protein